MKAYELRDDRGQKRTIEAAQLEPLFRSLLKPILIEMGFTPDIMAGCEINKLLYLIRSHIREQKSSLVVAQLEAQRLKDRRERDYETVLQFIRAEKLNSVDKGDSGIAEAFPEIRRVA